MLPGPSTHICHTGAGPCTSLWNRREINVSCHFLAVKTPTGSVQDLKTSNELPREGVWHRPGSASILFFYRVPDYPVVIRRKREVWIHIFNFALQMCLIFIQSLANIKNSNNLHECRVYHQLFTYCSRSLTYCALCQSMQRELQRYGVLLAVQNSYVIFILLVLLRSYINTCRVLREL